MCQPPQGVKDEKTSASETLIAYRWHDLDRPGVSVFGINDSGIVVRNFGGKGFVARANSFILKR
jgi:hypothetical protein